jgi:hypothetical protein
MMTMNGVVQKNVIQLLQHTTQILMNATVILAMQRLIITQMKITSNVVQFVNPVLPP